MRPRYRDNTRANHFCNIRNRERTHSSLRRQASPSSRIRASSRDSRDNLRGNKPAILRSSNHNSVPRYNRRGYLNRTPVVCRDMEYSNPDNMRANHRSNCIVEERQNKTKQKNVFPLTYLMSTEGGEKENEWITNRTITQSPHSTRV